MGIPLYPITFLSSVLWLFLVYHIVATRSVPCTLLAFLDYSGHSTSKLPLLHPSISSSVFPSPCSLCLTHIIFDGLFSLVLCLCPNHFSTSWSAFSIRLCKLPFPSFALPFFTQLTHFMSHCILRYFVSNILLTFTLFHSFAFKAQASHLFSIFRTTVP